MFEFTQLDGMSRLVMLKKQKETIEYWRAVYRLKGAFALWESTTFDLVRDYKAIGGVSDLTKAVDAVSVKGEVTIKKLENLTKRLDEYLTDMDTRLGDGVKWFNSLEIQAMFAEIEGKKS
jgi:hypothetical protein